MEEEAGDWSEDEVDGEEEDEDEEMVEEEAATHQPSQTERKDYVPH